MSTRASYSAEELDRDMVKVSAGKMIYGLRAAQKQALAEREGVHPDMLYFHSDEREMEVGEFWIDRHPVTREQFRRFQEATGHQVLQNGWQAGWARLTGWHDFSPEDDALPMVGVSSIEATAYAAWCGKRLPTEVEWEMAWRGTDGRLFPWGDEWKEGLAFRNPGNMGLKPPLPVGAFAPLGPHGLQDYGLVLEWVKNLDLSKGKVDATQHPYVLAGSSFLYTMAYSFCPTNRTSWCPDMRIYNSGFRCASDTPPPKPAISVYQPTEAPPPRPVAMRPELYQKDPIRLIPTDHATMLIEVPWFPESVWVLDCPEATWGGFGGANTWPMRAEEVWRVPWESNGDGSIWRYVREKEGQRQMVEIQAEGDTVRYRYETRGIAAIPDSFCFKTFSPFFTSQERRTQVRIGANGVTPCNQLPLNLTRDPEAVPPGGQAGFQWTLGWLEPPESAGLQSFDKKGLVLFPVKHQRAGGNGCYPCVHIRPFVYESDPKVAETQHGGGEMRFTIIA